MNVVAYDYALITADSTVDLASKVKAALEEGWELQGGACSYMYTGLETSGVVFTQAMKKTKLRY